MGITTDFVVLLPIHCLVTIDKKITKCLDTLYIFKQLALEKVHTCT